MKECINFNILGPNIGAIVKNVDLSTSLNDREFEALHHGLLKHQVLFIRDQNINPIQHAALAMRFGDLHIHPIYPYADEVKEIIVLDTHQDNPPDNDNWHTDVSFIHNPPAIAILSSKLLPLSGGDTLWASGIAAYQALSDAFKKLLRGLSAEHDFKKSFPEFKYCKNKKMHKIWQQTVRQNPPVTHPVIRTHPISGYQTLFVNEGFTTRILGVEEKESNILLNFLFSHIKKPEFQVRWRWKKNDLAIWDNRVTLHYANADYYPARRVMHRATILGDKPF